MYVILITFFLNRFKNMATMCGAEISINFTNDSFNSYYIFSTFVLFFNIITHFRFQQ